MIDPEHVWLLKLVLAHLLSDFILQPGSWISHRLLHHFASSRLYLHGLVTGVVALLFAGLAYWTAVVVIAISHVLIDGWKSYRRQTIGYFVIDQLLHLAVILLCWYYYFIPNESLHSFLREWLANGHFWVYVTAIIFLTTPAGIIIGQLTRSWRERLAHAESLENAGKWIGFVERLIVFLFVLVGQYAAISLLVAAKGIIRFNEKDRPEVKTEYLVIGTLLSIGIALVIGILVRRLTSLPI